MYAEPLLEPAADDHPFTTDYPHHSPWNWTCRSAQPRLAGSLDDRLARQRIDTDSVLEQP
jgi:hypothetical protein